MLLQLYFLLACFQHPLFLLELYYSQNPFLRCHSFFRMNKDFIYLYPGSQIFFGFTHIIYIRFENSSLSSNSLVSDSGSLVCFPTKFHQIQPFRFGINLTDNFFICLDSDLFPSKSVTAFLLNACYKCLQKVTPVYFASSSQVMGQGWGAQGWKLDAAHICL